MKRIKTTLGCLLLFAFIGSAQEQRPPAGTPETTSLLGVPLYAPPLTEASRRQLEENLARATADFIKDPDNADNIIWLGRRLAYIGRFREAIDVYTRGIAKHPKDFRLLRHRAHRYITLRQFDRAIVDLEKATQLIRGVPDQPEPDGSAPPKTGPGSTSHHNIWYHLGLAYYLKHDFPNALRSYRECIKFSQSSNERLVSTSDWLYMTLRRMGRSEEAAQVLAPIRKDMEIGENSAYFNRLLMYKGEKNPEELLAAGGNDALNLATYGYGIANWYFYNGQKDKAFELFRKVVQGTQWTAFGFIASEAELSLIKALQTR